MQEMHGNDWSLKVLELEVADDLPETEEPEGAGGAGTQGSGPVR